MIEYLHAILLGIVEGLTEFLPVSSTAHLLIAEEVLGFAGPPGKVFPVVIQLGAVLSVVVVYWRKFWDATVGLPSDPWARHFAIGLVIAFLPSAAMGAAFHGLIKEVLFSVPVIAGALIAGGIAILVIERIVPPARFSESDQLPWRKCLEIGCCQVLSLIPGISRSGATILGGMLLGVERKAAAEFTFFLAVPTMLGAFVYDLYKNWDGITMNGGLIIAIGFVVSFVAAYAVVRTFIAFISRYGFAPFAYYRIALGTLIFGVLYL